jgi:hypothetical protein
MANTNLTPERLRELLHYDEATGIFTRIKVSSNAKVGDIAGSLNSQGYLVFNVDGCLYSAHRLAWLYVRGSWPIHGIDHINGIRNDNRFVNLRDVSQTENMHNLQRANCNSKTKVLGVHWCKKEMKYIAQISINYKKIRIGAHETIDEAIKGRHLAESKFQPLSHV